MTFLMTLLPMMATAIPTAPAAVQGMKYHQIARVKVGGDGGWDYLIADSSSHRLFISRGTHVMVMDLSSMKVVGDIANTPGVHGIAIANSLNRGFTSNGRDNSVTIFNLKTLKPIATVKVGQNPDAIVYDPFTKRVFTCNGGSGNATAIDAKSGKVLGTITLAGRPEFAAVDGHGGLFVNIEDKSEVSSIDTKTLAVKASWKLGTGDGPSGLAIDAVNHRLFSVCGNKQMVITNSQTGKTVATVPIGDGVDAAGFDPTSKLAFSSNGEGNMTIVKETGPNAFKVVANVPTANGARTMAVDARTHWVYLVTAQFQPQAAGQTGGRRRPMVPGTFTVLVFGP